MRERDKVCKIIIHESKWSLLSLRMLVIIWILESRADNQRHKGNFYLSSSTLILGSTTDVHISKDSSCLWLYFNINFEDWTSKRFKIEAKNDKGSAYACFRFYLD